MHENDPGALALPRTMPVMADANFHYGKNGA
jgi:hypothetical protein